MSTSPLPSSPRRRYAVIGTGIRCRAFLQSQLEHFADTAELVGLCDLNQKRMDYMNESVVAPHRCLAPTYLAADFDRMVAEQKPDFIMVFTIDRTHHTYIIRALELGCDVVTEKPMTIDVPKCREILDAVERTGKQVRVAFNYRFSPSRTTVKDLLQKGTIGEIKAVHFEWLLDTFHGADYFRRWHRDKRNSGGLMVHKSTHHFDLVNWWLDSQPDTVFGFGSLAFYGKANAEARGEYRPYYRSTNDPAAKDCPYALDLEEHEIHKGLYYDVEKEDGYIRDQNVFGDGVSIEDTMNVLVRYKSGAQLSYTLSAYNPWEGYRIAFIGTKGRLELEEVENTATSREGSVGVGIVKGKKIMVYPHRAPAYEVEIPPAEGGHGGGDLPLMRTIFGSADQQEPDQYGRIADHHDGAQSILTGIAANQSFATGQAVKVDTLL